ncbi:C-type lectin domain family 2 member B-like [Aythya fuligula]|uniref:C-type lectin domain family 2 member B-like n=1 Tax=Aythya fuligula TaxID=219594 RepID=A0A6J3EIA7_AYTFU|nr:C-type lectin domain family 2 member B-like [Aythya fuligula]XP_032061107.1 C-type lectin domain family 2 member B-like [Aythya fuligula]XP_032061108.1 C-type lectin domain family 2 member B-like [Aythya fuligula]
MGKGAQEKTHPDQEEVLNPPRDAEKQCKWGSSPHWMGRKCHRVQKLLTPLCVVLSVLVFVLLVALIVVRLQSHSSHPQFSDVCPAMWIGFQSKCYYFSENESNWKTSLEKCKAMEASLTSIDSQEELNFIKRYKGPANHWFGLHEEDNGQLRWTNGTAFNNWFEVRGGGPCAYVNHERISSALCNTEKYWICSRPNNYVEWRQKIYP